ncbi:MAG: hypothetical protein WC776_05045, partial [Patescibacteria group bacterium]
TGTYKDPLTLQGSRSGTGPITGMEYVGAATGKLDAQGREILTPQPGVGGGLRFQTPGTPNALTPQQLGVPAPTAKDISAAASTASASLRTSVGADARSNVENFFTIPTSGILTTDGYESARNLSRRTEPTRTIYQRGG